MTSVYLGLGSNQGDREKNLDQAVDLIASFPQTELKELSSVYETEPWGYTEQPKFLNLCLELETELAPYDLLAECQKVEEKLDRTRQIKWGPRTIDVDILFYNDLNLNDSQLTIPHPRLHNRAFVLVPLCELNPDLVFQGEKITYWLEEVDKEGIKKYS
ncbi:2-amino-4-hydroxy-6-hydroxymethyldihydropteridine diphosphokinase [Halanaerobaculum tunisiense]